ncbi:MAG: class I SAM-dependent methyltransferase [Saprospiraceae bacterium]|nr:class I SAM-dependent methyltransferase [Saprospiraceae bacterium]
MRSYYRLQSKIYDATRWTFLFGRNRILKMLPFPDNAQIHILEIGCGTGYNLAQLAKIFPKASLTGMDVSGDMIKLAQKNTKAYADRVTLIEKPYMPDETAFTGKVDVILFSYSLTMINPQWQDLILKAKADLKPGGAIAVVDFHNSRFNWFKRHMGNNHVRMDSHLLPLLLSEFDSLVEEVKLAYGGVWEYVIYVGRKK